MGNLLGFSSFGNLLGGSSEAIKNTTSAAKGAMGSASNATANVSKEVAATGLGWLKWALPILLIAALVYWFMGKGSPADMVQDGMETVGEVGDDAMDAAQDVAGTLGDAAISTMDLAKSAFANVDEAARIALDKITFTAGSAGDQMMNFINNGFEGDPTFRFSNLNFATGSSDLTPEAQQEVDNLAAIMKAYPAVNVAIQGYTDNTGDAAANKQLSAERAGAVMGRLMAQGIDATRVKSVGFGQENPVADNSTEEGRAENRRIEVKIVK
jgi:outer membrane protein OmpA-like peptidoglycan-associated protein